MLTKKITRLSDSQGFIEAFEEEIKAGVHKTHFAAYESLEVMRTEHLGGRKFKNYDSFRISRAHHNKKRAPFFTPSVTQGVAGY